MIVFVSWQILSSFLETTFTSVCFFLLLFHEDEVAHFWQQHESPPSTCFFSQAQKTTSGTITRCHDQLGRPKDGLIAKTGLQDVFFFVLVPGNGKLVVWVGGLGFYREVTHNFIRESQESKPPQLTIGWLLCLFKRGGGVPIIYQLPRELTAQTPSKLMGLKTILPIFFQNRWPNSTNYSNKGCDSDSCLQLYIDGIRSDSGTWDEAILKLESVGCQELIVIQLIFL